MPTEEAFITLRALGRVALTDVIERGIALSLHIIRVEAGGGGKGEASLSRSEDIHGFGSRPRRVLDFATA